MVPLYKLVQASLARDDADGLPRGGRCRCRRVRAAPAPRRSVRSGGARGRRRRGLCGRRQVRRRPGRRPAAGIPRRHPRWIDRKADGPVAYLYDGEPSWNGVWETLFWNEKIDRVYDLGDTEVPGPLPQTPAEVRPDGTLFVPPSARQPGDYAVVSTWATLAGEKLKGVKQEGLSQAGLRLWHVQRPLRFREQISGLHVNGDIDAHEHRPAQRIRLPRRHVPAHLDPQETGDHRDPGERTARSQAHVQLGGPESGTATSRSTGAEANAPSR